MPPQNLQWFSVAAGWTVNLFGSKNKWRQLKLILGICSLEHLKREPFLCLPPFWFQICGGIARISSSVNGQWIDFRAEVGSLWMHAGAAGGTPTISRQTHILMNCEFKTQSKTPDWQITIQLWPIIQPDHYWWRVILTVRRDFLSLVLKTCGKPWPNLRFDNIPDFIASWLDKGSTYVQ